MAETPNVNIEPTPLITTPQIGVSANHRHCEDFVENALLNNPFLKFMITSMNARGCEVTRDFFKCRECPMEATGFYQPSLGIVLCENKSIQPSTVEHTLVHEIVHAFDNCRADIDYNDCVQVACTEIRAANLSGECNFFREASRGNFHVFRQYQKCVKRRTEVTLKMHPHCKQDASAYVEAAWRSCYRDNTPFSYDSR